MIHRARHLEGMRVHAALEGNDKAKQQSQKDTHFLILPTVIT
jgi:hypothetical protein